MLAFKVGPPQTSLFFDVVEAQTELTIVFGKPFHCKEFYLNSFSERNRWCFMPFELSANGGLNTVPLFPYFTPSSVSPSPTMLTQKTEQKEVDRRKSE